MWPEGFRCAASFTFDFDAEEVWIGEDPANADKPGVLSQGTYGAKVAVPLILELLATHGLFATFFIPARVAERHPHRVKEIASAGHEIAHHGYTHTSPTKLSRQEEEEELKKGLEILRSFGGEAIDCKFDAYPNISRWLDHMKALKSWPKVNEAFYKYVVEPNKGKDFVRV